MKNYVLTSEYDFASAHYLKGHTGKCRNAHGHNYLVRLEVGANELQTEGSSRSMVIDFYDIKQEFRALLDSLDHSTHLENPKYKDISNVVKDLDKNPTEANYLKIISKIARNSSLSEIRLP